MLCDVCKACCVALSRVCFTFVIRKWNDCLLHFLYIVMYFLYLFIFAHYYVFYTMYRAFLSRTVYGALALLDRLHVSSEPLLVFCVRCTGSSHSPACVERTAACVLCTVYCLFSLACMRRVNCCLCSVYGALALLTRLHASNEPLGTAFCVFHTVSHSAD